MAGTVRPEARVRIQTGESMARRDRREGEGSQSVRHGAQAPSADAQSSTRPVLQALHHLVGNHGVEGLEQAGTTDSMQLYLRHLTQISEGHQLDTSAYMPDVAPQSWLR